MKRTKEQLLQELAHWEQEFRRLQADYQRIMEISCGIIYTIDARGNFTFINQAVEDILHYRPEDLIGKHFSTILVPDEVQRVSRDHVLPFFKGQTTGPDNAPKLFDERRTGNRKTRNLEVRLVTKDKKEIASIVGEVTGLLTSEGYYKNGERNSSPKKSEEAFVGSQGIIYDISRFKAAENEKKELEEHLLEVERMNMVGRFTGTIAHELNNKLSTIIGFADILKKKCGDNSGMVECVEKIIDSSRSAADISNRLLDFSHKGNYEFTKIDINAAIQKVTRLLRHLISKKVQIKHFFHAHEPFITGNPTDIQNAILTLAMKICDQMDDPGDIIFATKAVSVDQEFAESHSLISNSGTFIQITLICTGLNQDAATTSIFFGALLDQNLVLESEKMGLATVHTCIKKHKGFVEVLRESGTSTKVDIFFPAAMPDQA